MPTTSLLPAPPTGTGKTYLAEAIGLHVCKMGLPVKKIRYKHLFEEIRAARGTGLYLNYIQKLQKIKVLIIDDFAMQPVTQDKLSDLLDIIEERNQMGPLIITTQYPLAKWHSLFDDPTTADAICDRLIPTAIKLELKGKSLRGGKEKDKLSVQHTYLQLLQQELLKSQGKIRGTGKDRAEC